MQTVTITITINAPRTLKVRVPAGRTTRETLERALTKARDRITLRAALPCP